MAVGAKSELIDGEIVADGRVPLNSKRNKSSRILRSR